VALGLATADILFFLDDDTFLFPDCAERILAIYAADPQRWIAGVTAPNHPSSPQASTTLEIKSTGAQSVGRLARLRMTPVGRWIWREIFLMDTLRLFVPYDLSRMAPDPAALQLMKDLNLSKVFSMFGYAMTVRRDVARQEPFDNNLLAYSPCEDTDASYRYSRHGLLVMAPDARLHHFEVGAARLKRRKVAALFLMNVAYLLRKHSQDLTLHRRHYMWLARRRVFAELLKDLISRRWSLPQFFGTLAALRKADRIFGHPLEGLEQWYEDQQKEVLAWP
jgi:GT2 family glycosyltransferase